MTSPIHRSIRVCDQPHQCLRSLHGLLETARISLFRNAKGAREASGSGRDERETEGTVTDSPRIRAITWICEATRDVRRISPVHESMRAEMEDHVGEGRNG